MALVIGFLVLICSRFVPLIHFGLLISVALSGGLIADLLLLPLLLRLKAKSSELSEPIQEVPTTPLPDQEESSVPLRV